MFSVVPDKKDEEKVKIGQIFGGYDSDQFSVAVGDKDGNLRKEELLEKLRRVRADELRENKENPSQLRHSQEEIKEVIQAASSKERESLGLENATHAVENRERDLVQTRSKLGAATDFDDQLAVRKIERAKDKLERDRSAIEKETEKQKRLSDVKEKAEELEFELRGKYNTLLQGNAKTSESGILQLTIEGEVYTVNHLLADTQLNYTVFKTDNEELGISLLIPGPGRETRLTFGLSSEERDGLELAA